MTPQKRSAIMQTQTNSLLMHIIVETYTPMPVLKLELLKKYHLLTRKVCRIFE